MPDRAQLYPEPTFQLYRSENWFCKAFVYQNYHVRQHMITHNWKWSKTLQVVGIVSMDRRIFNLKSQVPNTFDLIAIIGSFWAAI